MMVGGLARLVRHSMRTTGDLRRLKRDGLAQKENTPLNELFVLVFRNPVCFHHNTPANYPCLYPTGSQIAASFMMFSVQLNGRTWKYISLVEVERT